MILLSIGSLPVGAVATQAALASGSHQSFIHPMFKKFEVRVLLVQELQLQLPLDSVVV